MSKYCEQGSKTRDVGVKAPAYGQGAKVISEASKGTTGIVGQGGIGKNGVPK